MQIGGFAGIQRWKLVLKRKKKMHWYDAMLAREKRWYERIKNGGHRERSRDLDGKMGKVQWTTRHRHACKQSEAGHVLNPLIKSHPFPPFPTPLNCHTTVFLPLQIC